MTGARKFDELTHWDVWDRQHGVEGWSEPGWALPGDNTRYISRHDPYWTSVLNKARNAYGDPNIHFNSDDNVGQERYLVYGDGTRLPPDGTIVYHDAAGKKNWIQNSDGTVSLQNPDGTAGPAIKPTGYRPTSDGRYAPVDPHGNQVAPLAGGMPPSDNGFYTDPKTGILTPKNANGDYYTFDPATGQRSYFNKDGKPITKEQYDTGRPAPGAPGGDPKTLPTDEQQSGRTADAVKKVQEELKRRYTNISDAEEKLVESLLNARATTADGQAKLNDIQKKIVEAVNNPDLSLDTPAGESAFLKFLRGQVAAIGDVLKSGTLNADDQSKAIAALSNLYALDHGDPSQTDPEAPQPAPGQPPGTWPAAPSVPPGESADPGLLGPSEPLPDPTLGDLGVGGAPLGPDPLSSLASMLPAAMGGIPALGGPGGSPLDSLGGLAGAAGPLAGLASQLGDQAAHHDDPAKDDNSDKKSHDDQSNNDNKNGAEQPQQQPAPAPANQQPPQPQPNGTPGQGAPPAAQAPAPAPPPTSVQLPDGSTVNARTPGLAAAVKSYLAGTPLDVAYRQAGIELPPPGTPVTNPVDPSQLTAGAIGMFKDHYVVALSAAKAIQDGQVVSLASAASGPDFLGWIDPSALGAAAVTTQQPAVGNPVVPPGQLPPPAVAGPPPAAPVTSMSAPAG